MRNTRCGPASTSAIGTVETVGAAAALTDAGVADLQDVDDDEREADGDDCRRARRAGPRVTPPPRRGRGGPALPQQAGRDRDGDASARPTASSATERPVSCHRRPKQTDEAKRLSPTAVCTDAMPVARLPSGTAWLARALTTPSVAA